MNRRFCIWVLSSFVAFSSIFGAPSDVSAASNDEDVEALVQSVIEGDYASNNFKDALDKLALAKQACEGKKSCSPKVRAKVYIALGTVLAGGEKKQNEAKEAFITALKEDPTATLFGEYITPEIQKAFNDARSVASASTGSVEVKPGQQRKPKKEYTGGLKPARGWKSGEAFFYYRESLASEQNRDWLDCTDYAQASLAAENRPTTRMLAAACEEKAGLWIEAFADYKIVAETAGTRKYGLYDVANKAKARMKDLREKIPKITLRKPAKATDLQVKMNDSLIPANKIGGEIWVNPGQRVIEATGKIEGVDLEFEQVVDIAEYEAVTVDLQLGPKGSKDRALMKCLLSAKSREDFEKCVGGSGGGGGLRGLNLRMGFEVSGYHDSDHTDVVTPALSMVLENPTSGWGVSGSFLVDVVTTASADIISTASPRWTETRYVPALSGHKKFGDVDVNLHTSASIEPDYLAIGVGAGVSAELRQKTITPSLNYDFGYDIAGRSGTTFDVFSREIHRHGIDAGLGFIIDKATFAVLSLTTVFDFGDQSKPYRYIPLFDPGVAPFVPAGLTVEGVAQARLPERVLEQVPLSRQRFALAGRIGHRFSSSTIRADQRFYIDSWGVKASTTDAKFIYDVSDRFRVWPHLRFNVQTGADFWQRAYTVQRNQALNLTALPALRAGDRELGPMFALTGGGGARYEFGEKKEFAFQLTADMIFTRFLDHLYILQRFGYFGASTFEMEFE